MAGRRGCWQPASVRLKKSGLPSSRERRNSDRACLRWLWRPRSQALRRFAGSPALSVLRSVALAQNSKRYPARVEKPAGLKLDQIPARSALAQPAHSSTSAYPGPSLASTPALR